MKLRLIIQLKQGVLDPQGKAINHALIMQCMVNRLTLWIENTLFQLNNQT